MELGVDELKPGRRALLYARWGSLGSQTNAEMARGAKVSWSTMSNARKTLRDDPKRADMIINGGKPKRRKQKARVDHAAREAEVMRLYGEGMSNAEIAQQMGLHKSGVSAIKVRLGIAETSPLVKISADVNHVVMALKGARLQINSLTEQLLAGTTALNEQKEIEAWVKELSTTLLAIKKLRNAIRKPTLKSR